MPDTTMNVKEIKNRIIVAGGNGQGSGTDQLSCPNGLFVDDDQTIYVAEWSNHRIMEWKNGAMYGQVVAGGNGQGNRTDQLSNPTDVIVDKENNSLIICDYGNKRVVRWPRQNGTTGEIILSDIACWGLAMDSNRYLYVSDISKHDVKRWIIGDMNGTVVAGGNGQGNRLNQLNYPYYIFVDQDQSIYVSDGNNHRIVKWMRGAKEGILVAGIHGKGNGVTQLSNPRGIVVHQLGMIYIADCSNYRVMRWSKGATQGNVVAGGNGQGAQPTQFNAPLGLSFDRQGNLYVADYGNHRVQKFYVGLNSNT
jgi:sugar lactone lactonase YvrE